jgi:hypothetical protein
MNAVVDALSEYGIHHIDMPATPFRVWQAIQAAQREGAMRYGIHNPSWWYGPDPAEAFEAVKAKAQWAEIHGHTCTKGVSTWPRSCACSTMIQ